MKYIRTVISLVVLLGCDPNEVPQSEYLIKEVLDPAGYSDFYAYERGNLVSFKRRLGNREETTCELTYFNDLLIKVETIRDNGTKSLVELSYHDDKKRSQEIITFTDNNNTSSSITKTFSYVDHTLASIKYTYSDSNFYPSETIIHWDHGNLVRKDYYGVVNGMRKQDGSELFHYDNRKNYFKQKLASIYLPDGDETRASINNVLSTTFNLPDGQILEGGQYSFTYDTNNYPTSYIYRMNNQEFPAVQIKYY